MIHGNYRIWLPRKTGLILPPEPDIILPNRVTDVGEQEFLKMIFQDVTEIAGGANWYIGLCNQTPNEVDELTDISTEPDGTGGYARQALVRSAVGWPTITEVNGHTVIRSDSVDFAASGGDFSKTITRAFLTDQSSGTAGILYSYSGALIEALQISDGDTFTMEYEVYLD